MNDRRVTIALGAGGPVGHAFHAGALSALADVLSWDPRRAHLLLGTSAGAQVGALLRAGMSASDLLARVSGGALSPEGAAIAQHFTRPSHRQSEPDARPYRPASPRYLLNGLMRPWKARPGRIVSALLPAGRTDLSPQAEGLRNLFGDRWPEERLWITAVCLHSGELHAFGRPGAPETDVGTAVACSGAVPALCAPVPVGARRFIDGGVASATNLDLLREDSEDVVIVSSPLSMYASMRLLLRMEVRRLRAAGKRVVVHEPEGEAAAAMGKNPMDSTRAPSVAAATRRVMLRALKQRRELRDAL